MTKTTFKEKTDDENRHQNEINTQRHQHYHQKELFNPLKLLEDDVLIPSNVIIEEPT